MQEAPYDVEIIVEGCPPLDASHDLTVAISRWAAKGAYRFLITLQGSSFSGCLDFLREALQSFLFASFTVRDGGEPAGAVRVRIRAASPDLEVVE